MKNLMGQPHALKEVNLSIVRREIRERGTATCAELADATQISVTTVRALLNEMLVNGEIIDAGFDESIGGRRAVRYKLRKDKFFGVSLCLDGANIRYLTVNICGDIQEEGIFPIREDITKTICSFLDSVTSKMVIKSIGIGVPGIVNSMEYQKKNSNGEMESYPIGAIIHQKYGVPVFLENDLNAIALGFGRCYLNEYPEEVCENVNMGYIQFEKDCISAGFLSGGRIVRGWNNYAGELGLLPAGEGMTLDNLLASELSDEKYSEIVAKVISGVCCVLNPQLMAVGGNNFRKNCLPMINEHFKNYLPGKMAARIIYAEHKWHDYFEGMAYLTSEKIFEDVLLVKR